MAYSDYGAFVFCNGERRKDKEDAQIFEGGVYPILNCSHGVMGDGDIRVRCYKQGLPTILERIEGKIKDICYCAEDTDHFEYETIRFNYKGYSFCFKDGKPYEALMTTPEGDIWECTYDYCYGAGFEEDDNG